jgi:hypothetical protein
MKRVGCWLVCCLVVMLTACTPSSSFKVDSQFVALVSPENSPLVLANQVDLSTDDQDALVSMLNTNQWTKITRSKDPQTKSLILIGTSQVIYTIYAQESVPVIAVDKDADGKTDMYYGAASLQAPELTVWTNAVISAHRAKTVITQSVLTQVILDRIDPNLDSARFELLAEDASDLLDQLQVGLWQHLPDLPTVDLTSLNRLSLVSVGSDTMIITMYLLPGQTLVVIQDEDNARLGVYKAPLTLGSTLLSTLQSMADALAPDHELANLIFTQGYIGPMQFIYEPSQNDPDYYFTLSPAQQIAVLESLDPTSWVKRTVSEPTPLYAEFAVMDADGKTYYFTEMSVETIVITIVDPLQPALTVEYQWATSDFMAANTQLMTYFVPAAPPADLLDAQYVAASFYEGEVMDMTPPDITVSLSASQSKTIKDFIDPFSWRQAIDIPPMGPALGFTLEDESGRQYNFLFVGEYVLVSVVTDETSPLSWWVGSMSGADEAREFLLTLAP